MFVVRDHYFQRKGLLAYITLCVIIFPYFLVFIFNQTHGDAVSFDDDGRSEKEDTSRLLVNNPRAQAEIERVCSSICWLVVCVRACMCARLSLNLLFFLIPISNRNLKTLAHPVPTSLSFSLLPTTQPPAPAHARVQQIETKARPTERFEKRFQQVRRSLESSSELRTDYRRSVASSR